LDLLPEKRESAHPGASMLAFGKDIKVLIMKKKESRNGRDEPDHGSRDRIGGFPVPEKATEHLQQGLGIPVPEA
jgi:hypothetical protein